MTEVRQPNHHPSSLIPHPSTDELLRFRAKFPILANTKYLVSHSLGAMPEAARDALEEFADTWASRGVRAWGEKWWMMSIDVGDVIAPLLGAAPGSVVMLPNVTTAEAVVLSSFEFEPPRNRVVIVEGEFPSVRYVYDRLAKRFGAEVITVGYDDLLDAIDERTQLVPMSHVFFETSFTADVPAIARRCREAGATLVLDVFQSYRRSRAAVVKRAQRWCWTSFNPRESFR